MSITTTRNQTQRHMIICMVPKPEFLSPYYSFGPYATFSSSRWFQCSMEITTCSMKPFQVIPSKVIAAITISNKRILKLKHSSSSRGLTTIFGIMTLIFSMTRDRSTRHLIWSLIQLRLRDTLLLSLLSKTELQTTKKMAPRNQTIWSMARLSKNVIITQIKIMMSQISWVPTKLEDSVLIGSRLT
jgi:hypothetical protein